MITAIRTYSLNCTLILYQSSKNVTIFKYGWRFETLDFFKYKTSHRKVKRQNSETFFVTNVPKLQGNCQRKEMEILPKKKMSLFNFCIKCRILTCR